MKKLKRLEFDQPEEQMPPVDVNILRTIIGGGNGSYDNPYTQAEMDSMMDAETWNGGFVEGMGYV